MVKELCIRILIENSVHEKGLLAEHGLAYWIEVDEQAVLFDTGQTGLVVDNATKLGIKLPQADAIVLSHGHADHTGGLPKAVQVAPQARIVLHPDALQPKYSLKNSTKGAFIGASAECVATVRRAGDRVCWSPEPVEVVKGLFVTGTVPRRNDFEDTGGAFYRDENCQIPDPLYDDQALYCDTHRGLVIVLGCGHAGVVNTVEYIQTLNPGRPLYALIGGMHLLRSGAERIDRTVEYFRKWNFKMMAPCHCTGLHAVSRLWHAFPQEFKGCHVGTMFHFKPAA